MTKQKFAYLQITRKCNNKCIFCSNPQFDKDYSLKEAKQRVMEFKKGGITDIFLTGGEPTLVNFLPILISFIEHKEINVGMITNGIELSDKKIIKKIYDSGLREINVSIHSSKEKIADKLSQKKGHFKKALSGIKNALDIGMDIRLNSTINSLNCTHLSDNVKFFIKKFPKIKHYIFNNLDPGKSDGTLKSRAGENPWIIAKLTDMEIELNKMVKILKKNKKTFRIERVPLCYMGGFEEFSTETRKIVKNEQYICSFIEKNKENQVRRITANQLRTKVDCCEQCKLNNVCAGIQQEYLDMHGADELYPVFINPKNIINRIKY